MSWTPTDTDDALNRRSVLAAGATGLAAATSGCVDLVGSVVNLDKNALSLSIVTVPADADRQNVRIVRHLEKNLEAVGVDVSIRWRPRSTSLEEVLIDNDYDLYVGRHPGGFDPDFLYETLHPAFEWESGWQNPFQYTGDAFDPHLENQRLTDGDERREHVGELLRWINKVTPFEPVCFPTETRAVGPDVGTPDSGRLDSCLDYRQMDVEGDRLTALVTGSGITRNLNPFSATTRDHETVIDLLYDSVLTERHVEDETELIPWLADDVEWTHENPKPTGFWSSIDGGLEYVPDSWFEPVDGPLERNGAASNTLDPLQSNESTPPADPNESTPPADLNEGAPPADPNEDVVTWAKISLREDCEFHFVGEDERDQQDPDKRYVTAQHVVFTYHLLRDTALGGGDTPSPPPRYRGHGAAVDSYHIEDRNTVWLGFSAGRAASERALTAPILPGHRWLELVDNRLKNAPDAPQARWPPVTRSNVPPTGSGPYRYVDSESRVELTLERVEGHFVEEIAEEDDAFPEEPADELYFNVDPGSASSIQRVQNGAADVTASMLEAHSFSEETFEPDDLDSFSGDSRSFYYLAFNCDRSPLINHRVRRAIARLVDKEWIVDEVFGGDDATVADAPLPAEWHPDDLPTTSFAGESGTGEIDLEDALEPFRESFRYDGNRLLER